MNPLIESHGMEAEAAQPEVPGTPIRAAANAAVPPQAKAMPDGECIRPFVNDQLNSRLNREIPSGPLTVRWQANLAPEFPTKFVLAAGDRILTQGVGRWQLFDLEGKTLGGGKLGAGDVVMDNPKGLFYSIDPFGVIEAHRLKDATLDFSVSISGGEEWQRVFHARRGHKWAIVSFQRQIQPHAAISPAAVAIDVEDLGNPPDIQQQIVVSAKQESRLYYELPTASAALLGETLVVGMRNQFLITAFGKKVLTRLVDKFETGPLSLDEAGRIYVLVNLPGRTQPVLWALTPGGEREFAYQVPEEVQLKATPPVVGHNHQVYLTTRDSVICVGPQGTQLWRQLSQGMLAGISITPNDTVLVAEGSSVSAFDSRGERRVIYAFKGDSLVTAPIVTKDGDILVASANRLYCLSGARK